MWQISWDEFGAAFVRNLEKKRLLFLSEQALWSMHTEKTVYQVD
jgi:hypothetical protein